MKRPEKNGLQKDRYTALTVHRHRCLSYRFEPPHSFYLLHHLITASLKKTPSHISLANLLLNTSDRHKRRYGIHLTSNGCLTHDLPRPRWLSQSSARSPTLPPPSLEDKHWTGPVGSSWACGNAYRRKNSSEGFFFFFSCRALGASERDNSLLSYTLRSCRRYQITDGDGDLKVH